GVVDAIGRHARQDVPCPGTPEPDDRPALGFVDDNDMVDRRVIGGSSDEPAEVGGEVAGAGQYPEAVLGEPGCGDVRDDPAIRVQELRVDRRSDRSVDVVRGGALQERDGTGTRDLDLAE